MTEERTSYMPRRPERPHDYEFVDTWRVRATPDEVFDVISDAPGLARWWPSAFTKIVQIQPGEEDGINQVNQVESRGFLPYRLRWVTGTTQIDRPHGFAFHVSGDFEGTGEWRFEADGDWTVVTFTWRVSVNKALVKNLSLPLKPLFRANHRWAMDMGEKSLRLELARRKAPDESTRRAVGAPPEAKATRAAPVVLGVGIVGLVLMGLLRGRG